MHTRDLGDWQHSHDFIPEGHERNERKTRLVIALTAVMMVVEIVAGTVYNSMALLADGWHMASHASALGITAFAYWFARRHRDDPRFTFGTGKVSVLGGYSSAVVLGVIALLVAWESLGRFLSPRTISFDEAIAVAVVGLVVNVVSAWILQDDHAHGDHGHAHAHGPAGELEGHAHDHNLRAAYLHVLADALTSVTAIVALLTGKLYGWTWMDPAMGVVGSVLIGRWSYGLLRDSSAVLLDGDVPAATRETLRSVLQDGSTDRVADLHVWRVGPGRLAAAVAVVSDAPRSPDDYKRAMASAVPLSHATVEVNRCRSHPPVSEPG
jgi:cation diffusion facilitator family transporter